MNTFNKRVEPLLVVFKPDVRDSLIVTKPEDRQFFTNKQCELINGLARREGDQDDLDDVLSLSTEEQVFWGKMGQNPDRFLEPLGIF